MKCQLTDKKIASLKADTKRLDVHDTLLTGFGVRVTPKGLKTFFVVYRTNGKQKREKIGYYPQMSLSQARQKAQEFLIKASSGELDKSQVRELTVEEAFNEFVEKHINIHNKDKTCTRNRIYNNFVALYKDKSIKEITKLDIHNALDKMMKRDAPIQANRVLAGIKKFMRWCSQRDYIVSNPAIDLSPPAKETPCDRVLNIEEAQILYNYANKLGYPFGPYFQLLFLTGQRRNEVAKMKWSEINFETSMWVIPASRAKNEKEHNVPLSHQALKILRHMPRFSYSDYVFTTTGKTPISGMSKVKKTIQNNIELEHWTIHDIRRSVATRMAELKVPPHIIEKIINHASGIISGVARIYNQFGYDDEKREALQLWADYLMDFSNGKKIRRVKS